MLHDVAHGTRGLVGAARRPRRSTALVARLRARARARAARARGSCSVVGGRGARVGAAFVATQLPQEFVPSQDQSRLSVRLTTDGRREPRRDRRARQDAPSSSSRSTPRSIGVHDQRVSVGSGAAVSSRWSTRSSASSRSSEFSADAAQGAQLVSRASARRVQDLSQQGFGGSKGFPVEFSVRGTDWDTLVARRDEAPDGARASPGSSTDVDSDYQLGAPELAITPDRAARDRPRRHRHRHRDHGERARRRRDRRPVLDRDGRRIDIACACSRRSARAPRTSSVLRVRDRRTATARAAVVGRRPREQRPSSSTINHADRERAITITGNVAPGPLAERGARLRPDARERRCRPATASCWRARARSSATR